MKMSDVKRIIAEELEGIEFSEKEHGYDPLASSVESLVDNIEQGKLKYENFKNAALALKKHSPEVYKQLDEALRLFYKYLLSESSLEEVAPPGREDQVKALKKELPKTYKDSSGKTKESNPWAASWASYKKDKGLDEIQGIVKELLAKHGYKGK